MILRCAQYKFNLSIPSISACSRCGVARSWSFIKITSEISQLEMLQQPRSLIQKSVYKMNGRALTFLVSVYLASRLWTLSLSIEVGKFERVETHFKQREFKFRNSIWLPTCESRARICEFFSNLRRPALKRSNRPSLAIWQPNSKLASENAFFDLPNLLPATRQFWRKIN